MTLINNAQFMEKNKNLVPIKTLSKYTVYSECQHNANGFRWDLYVRQANVNIILIVKIEEKFCGAFYWYIEFYFIFIFYCSISLQIYYH